MNFADILNQLLPLIVEPLLLIVLTLAALVLRTVTGEWLTAGQQRTLHSAVATAVAPMALRKAGIQISEADLMRLKGEAQAYVFGDGAGASAKKLGVTPVAVDKLVERKLLEGGVRVADAAPGG
jgi:hypothetical protein